jgi:hypothetical protein
MGETRSGNRLGKEKHEARKPMRRWGNIRMNHDGRVCVDADWIQMAQNGIQKRGSFLAQ